MAARFGTNMNVAVALTLGAPKRITAVSKAMPGVATSPSHGLSNGAVGFFTVTDGMVELDGQIVRIAGVDTNTFQLEGLDTTDYSTFVASGSPESGGTFTPITAWATLANAQNISLPDATPAKIDITRLIDKRKQYAYGLPESPDGSIAGLYDPNTVAGALIKAASKANSPLAARISWAAGQKTYLNAFWSGGSGFDLQANQAATATIALTPINDIMDYES